MNTSRSSVRVPPLPSKRPLSQLKSAGSTAKKFEPEPLASKEVENQNPNCGNEMRKKRANAVSIRIPGMRSNILSEDSAIANRRVERRMVTNTDEKDSTNSELQRNGERSIVEDGKVTAGTDRREQRDIATRRKRRNQLLSSRLKGLKGNSMRAKRVVIQEPVTSDVEGNGESQNEENSILESSLVKSSMVKSTVKIPRLADLRYMLDWDPQANRSHSSNNENNAPSTRPQQNLDTIRETGQTPSQSKSENTSSQTSSQNTSQTSSQNTSQTSSQNTTHTSGQKQNSISESSSPPVANELSSEYKGEKTNFDFLPIVREKNMIYVNGTPYSKLSVIGKGGSCKVYRTLSKDRNIVAIKKVKLAGMKKKAIEGYANEISLLRRLRENQAIIQMYDSQVDLERKAIYLVMEVGEVDLNHVLQSQRLANGTLNMNFIRLTWQQMLNAVHCIHQERIIHSDLKPANFLFVKGVLKLIDFGIAKAIQTDDTTNIYRESQVGTLNYMSPESIIDTGTGVNGARMKCGKPSDVWSLGCILYQMCYRRTPFADIQNMFQKMKAIVDPNHEIRFENNVALAAIDAMKRCLERDPADRAEIVGESGLLNTHFFLHAERLKTL